MKSSIDIFRLTTLAGFSRAIIGIVGFFQIQIVITQYGLTEYGKIAALLSIAPIGLILESGMSWGLRFKIAKMHDESEIRKLTLQAFRRNFVAVLFLNSILSVFFILNATSFFGACCLTLMFSLLSVAFVPWIRCLEGTQNQYKILLAQLISSLLGLLTLILVGKNGNFLLLTIIFMSVGVVSGLLSSVQVIMAKPLFRNASVYLDHNDQDPSFSSFHSIVIAICGTLLFSAHPMFIYFLEGSTASAKYGIQIRVLSIFIGVLSVLATQMQVGFFRSRTRFAFQGPSMFRLFLASLFGGTLYLVVVSAANSILLDKTFLDIDSLDLSYSLLVILSILQIPFSTRDLGINGIRWQANSLFKVCVAALMIIFIFPVFRPEFVWVINLLYCLLFVAPLMFKTFRESKTS